MFVLRAACPARLQTVAGGAFLGLGRPALPPGNPFRFEPLPLQPQACVSQSNPPPAADLECGQLARADSSADSLLGQPKVRREGAQGQETVRVGKVPVHARAFSGATG